MADERYVGHDTVTAVVQIKGKVRAKLEVPVDIDPADLEKQALAAVADRLGGKEPRKVIVKAPKIVSIVPAEGLVASQLPSLRELARVARLRGASTAHLNCG